MSWPTCLRDETMPGTPNSRHRSIEHIERELQTCSGRSAGMTKRHQPWARGTRPARSFTSPTVDRQAERLGIALPSSPMKGGEEVTIDAKRRGEAGANLCLSPL